MKPKKEWEKHWDSIRPTHIDYDEKPSSFIDGDFIAETCDIMTEPVCAAVEAGVVILEESLNLVPVVVESGIELVVCGFQLVGLVLSLALSAGVIFIMFWAIQLMVGFLMIILNVV